MLLSQVVSEAKRLSRQYRREAARALAPTLFFLLPTQPAEPLEWAQLAPQGMTACRPLTNYLPPVSTYKP